MKSIRRELSHGSGYSETRLILLLTPWQAENAERPGAGVSL